MSIMFLSALFCTFTISKLKMKTHNTCLLFEIWKIKNSKIITHNLTTWRLLLNVSTHFLVKGKWTNHLSILWRLKWWHLKAKYQYCTWKQVISDSSKKVRDRKCTWHRCRRVKSQMSRTLQHSGRNLYDTFNFIWPCFRTLPF